MVLPQASIINPVLSLVPHLQTSLITFKENFSGVSCGEEEKGWSKTNIHIVV